MSFKIFKTTRLIYSKKNGMSINMSERPFKIGCNILKTIIKLLDKANDSSLIVIHSRDEILNITFNANNYISRYLQHFYTIILLFKLFFFSESLYRKSSFFRIVCIFLSFKIHFLQIYQKNGCLLPLH